MHHYLTFGKLFESAEIAGFDPEKRLNYEKDMFTERDRLVREAHIEKKGEEKGRAEEKVEIARNLKAMGLDVAAIMKATGLTEEQVAEL